MKRSKNKRKRTAPKAHLHGHTVFGVLHSIERVVLTSIRNIDKESIDTVLTSIEQARRALLKDMRESLDAEAMEEANRMS